MDVYMALSSCLVGKIIITRFSCLFFIINEIDVNDFRVAMISVIEMIIEFISDDVTEIY